MSMKSDINIKKKEKIYKEWDSVKNGVPIDSINYGSKKKYWWICPMGHSYDASMDNRTKEDRPRGCPYCSNKKVLVGYNDIWTTNPEIAKLLHISEDGYKYTFGSSAKVDWVCSNCSSVISNKAISSIRYYGIKCGRCSDGISFGEKVIYNLLLENNITFYYDSAFTWSNNKRYDFFLPKYNTIIEVHGRQHYVETSGKFSKSLSEETNNDLYKYTMAKDNSIYNYIIIDARFSTEEWLKNSILSSSIVNIVKDIDFNIIFQKSSKTIIKIASELWNNGENTSRIVEKLKLGRGAIIHYLKVGSKLGWNNYDAKKEKKKAGHSQGLLNSKAVIQWSLDGNFIKEWNSGLDASIALNVSKYNISSVCTGKRNSAGGFKWSHK